VDKDWGEILILNRFQDPSEGGFEWWHQDNGETYRKLYWRLQEWGLPPERAYEVLSEAFSAASDEYGA
jgi:hypothetical protein